MGRNGQHDVKIIEPIRDDPKVLGKRQAAIKAEIARLMATQTDPIFSTQVAVWAAGTVAKNREQFNSELCHQFVLRARSEGIAFSAAIKANAEQVSKTQTMSVDDFAVALIPLLNELETLLVNRAVGAVKDYTENHNPLAMVDDFHDYTQQPVFSHFLIMESFAKWNVSDTSTKTFDEAFLELHGFSISDMIEVALSMDQLLKETLDEDQAVLNLAMRVVSPSESYAKDTIRAFAITRVDGFIAISELASELPHIEREKIAKILQVFEFSPEENEFAAGVGLANSPVIFSKDREGIQVNAPLSAAMFRFVDSSLSQNLGSTYFDFRGKWLEGYIKHLVDEVVPGSKTILGVTWQTDSDKGEIDALTSFGPVTVVWEAKSHKRSSSQPRKVNGFVRNTIGKAMEQLKRFEQARTDPTFKITSSVPPWFKKALEAEIIVPAIVTLDNQVHRDLSKLRREGKIVNVPAILRCGDLMAAGHLLQNELLPWVAAEKASNQLGQQVGISSLDRLDNWAMFGSSRSDALPHLPLGMRHASETITPFFEEYIFDVVRKYVPTTVTSGSHEWPVRHMAPMFNLCFERLSKSNNPDAKMAAFALAQLPIEMRLQLEEVFVGLASPDVKGGHVISNFMLITVKPRAYRSAKLDRALAEELSGEVAATALPTRLTIEVDNPGTHGMRVTSVKFESDIPFSDVIGLTPWSVGSAHNRLTITPVGTDAGGFGRG